MKIVTLLIACVVFGALFVVDTGALLGLAFSWVMSGPTYRWALLSVCFGIVALYFGLENAGALLLRAVQTALARHAGARQGARKSPHGLVVSKNPS